jgi:hypothetical protein
MTVFVLRFELYRGEPPTATAVFREEVDAHTEVLDFAYKQGFTGDADDLDGAIAHLRTMGHDASIQECAVR